jgi:hypothetical protein
MKRVSVEHVANPLFVKDAEYREDPVRGATTR